MTRMPTDRLSAPGATILTLPTAAPPTATTDLAGSSAESSSVLARGMAGMVDTTATTTALTTVTVEDTMATADTMAMTAATVTGADILRARFLTAATAIAVDIHRDLPAHPTLLALL